MPLEGWQLSFLLQAASYETKNPRLLGEAIEEVGILLGCGGNEGYTPTREALTDLLTLPPSRASDG